MDWSSSEDGINMGKTEITYMKYRWHIEENQILDNDNVKNIEYTPTYIVHGQYDLVCTPNQAQELADRLKDVVLHFPISGHAGSQPETVHYLIESSDALAKRLKQEMKVVKLPEKSLGKFGVANQTNVNSNDKDSQFKFN